MISLVALVLAVPLAQSEPVQPRLFASTSGEFELHVDPSDTSGGGPGRHELRRNGASVWEKTLPVTLLDAVVTRDGTVAGYGYPETFWRVGATSLHVLVIGVDGAIRRTHTVKQRGPDAPHASPYPVGIGLLCDEDRDRLVVRVSEPGSRAWWTYRLSDGIQTGEFLPPTASPGDGSPAVIADARSIPGVSLDLVHYRTNGGASYALMDESGRIVWSLELVDNGAALLSTGRRSFAVLHASTNERVDYVVEELGSGWTAIETGRRPHAPDPEQHDDVEVFDVSLPLLGTTRLASDDPTNSLDVLEKPGAVGVDPFGRIHIQDDATGSVHVFDRTGRRVLLCRAAPGDVDGAGVMAQFAFGPEGDIYVKDVGRRPFDEVRGRVRRAKQSGAYLHFAADGSRLGVADLGGVQVAFAPSGILLAGRNGARWCLSRDRQDELSIRSADDAVLVSHDRRPGDRRWLDPSILRALAVAPDGSAAVLSEGLALFATDGAPLRTVALPEDAGDQLDFDGKRALLSGFDPTVHIVLLSDDSVQRFTTDREAEGTSWRSFLAPGESELWMIEGFEWSPKKPPRLALHRFALN